MAKTIYEVGGVRVTRKNTYMPCILGRKVNNGEISPEEHVRLLKRTYWSDYFTETEWQTLLGKNAKSEKVYKSRLKKKVAGWLMLMARYAQLRPEWYQEAVELACSEYKDLTGEPLPWGIMPRSR